MIGKFKIRKGISQTKKANSIKIQIPGASVGRMTQKTGFEQN